MTTVKKSKIRDAEIAERDEKLHRLTLDFKRLEKEVISQRTIRKEIFKLATIKHKIPDWCINRKYKELLNCPGVPVILCSDWHVGEVVNKAEIYGVNKYDLEIMEKRAKTLIETTINLLKHNSQIKKNYPGIVMCLMGDMISGDIHDELRETNEMQSIPTLLHLSNILIGCIDILIKEFGNVLIPCVTGNHGRNCYDEETEILTQNGWKFINEINQTEDKIAAYNPILDTIQYEIPEQWYINNDYTGDMIQIKSKGVNLVVTPEHKLWVKHLSGKCAGKLYEYEFSKRQANERIWSDTWVSQGGIYGWKGNIEPITVKASKASTGFIINPDQLWAEFFGWYISEGCSDDSRITISQSITKNYEKYIKIQDIIIGLGFEPKCSDTYIRFGSSPLCNFLNEQFGRGSHNKKLPDWLKNWPPDLLKSFLNAAMDGDGYWETESSGRYTSTSDKLIDDMQEICFKIGYSTKACSRYSSDVKGTKYKGTARKLNISKKIFRSLSKSKTIQYSGTIWCPTVSTGLVVVRREGRVIISGNTLKMRAKQRAHTSYDWLLYQMLESHYTEKYKGKVSPIKFLSTLAPDVSFQVYNTKFLVTHGDTLGKGGDGIIGCVGPIIRGDQKTRARNLQIGMPYDIMLLGHFHQLMWHSRFISNGSLVGYNEFASNVLRAPYEVPKQALFIVHPDHGITYKIDVLVEQVEKEKTSWVSWPEAK